MLGVGCLECNLYSADFKAELGADTCSTPKVSKEDGGEVGAGQAHPAALTVGSRVCLAPNFRSCDDAEGGDEDEENDEISSVRFS